MASQAYIATVRTALLKGLPQDEMTKVRKRRKNGRQSTRLQLYAQVPMDAVAGELAVLDSSLRAHFHNKPHYVESIKKRTEVRGTGVSFKLTGI